MLGPQEQKKATNPFSLSPFGDPVIVETAEALGSHSHGFKFCYHLTVAWPQPSFSNSLSPCFLLANRREEHLPHRSIVRFSGKEECAISSRAFRGEQCQVFVPLPCQPLSFSPASLFPHVYTSHGFPPPCPCSCSSCQQHGFLWFSQCLFKCHKMSCRPWSSPLYSISLAPCIRLCSVI